MVQSGYIGLLRWMCRHCYRMLGRETYECGFDSNRLPRQCSDFRATHRKPNFTKRVSLILDDAQGS